METKAYNLIEPKDLAKNTTINLQVCEAEVDMYWRVAIDVLEVIEANNRKGEPTVMVVPYGPLGPYARLVYLVNKYRVSLKNCVFCNMDEYVTDDKKFIDINCMLGIGGVLTFKNSEKLKNIVKCIDVKYLLLETDSPYLSPEPLRGKKNQPYNIIYVAQKISEIKQIPLDYVLNETTKNAVSQFDLKITL